VCRDFGVFDSRPREKLAQGLALGKPQVFIAFERNLPKGFHLGNPKFFLHSGEIGPSVGNSWFSNLDSGRNQSSAGNSRFLSLDE
jgi:hypothetical protein